MKIKTTLLKAITTTKTDDSDKIVRRLERELQNNQHGFGVPKLNGISVVNSQ